MNGRGFASFITSISLHGLILFLIIFTWKVAPIIAPEASISVDIIADVASSIGNSQNKAQTDPEPIDSPEPQESNTEPQDAPIVDTAPNPTPIVPPKVQPKTTPPTPKTPPPKQMAANAPSPKPIIKQKQTPQAPPSPTTRGNDTPLFDIAAATKSAAGVNAGGRSTPKLNNNSGSRRRSSGSGERLQGDLAGLLRSQVSPCWHEPADLSNPQRLIVEISMELNQDGNLIRPPRLIRPTSRNGADSTLLVAIDNALRAAQQCAPYDLPSDRFEDWQNFVFRFDPREMKR